MTDTFDWLKTIDEIEAEVSALEGKRKADPKPFRVAGSIGKPVVGSLKKQAQGMEGRFRSWADRLHRL